MYLIDTPRPHLTVLFGGKIKESYSKVHVADDTITVRERTVDTWMYERPFFDHDSRFGYDRVRLC